MKRFSKSTAYKTVLLLFILFQTPVLIAQVGINQPNPDSSAVMDLKSNNRGVLMPRLTSAEIQSITNPSEGLLVYCTDLKIFCFFDGTDWISLPAWGQKLDLADPSASQNINAKENANSNVGIGTTTPASKVTIDGNLAVGNNTAAPANGAYINGQVKVGSAPNAGDTEPVEVDGNINANGKLKEYGEDLLPAGAIIMWSGTLPPEGWALCNGNTYTYHGKTTTTPNLSGRFIVAAGTRKTITLNQDGKISEGTSESFTIGHGNIQAADYVKLSTSQIPSHTHSGNTSKNGAHEHSMSFDKGDGGPYEGTKITVSSTTCGDATGCAGNGLGYTYPVSSHQHSFTTDGTGGSLKHENRPPYYVLAFIIKL